MKKGRWKDLSCKGKSKISMRDQCTVKFQRGIEGRWKDLSCKGESKISMRDQCTVKKKI